MDKSNIVADTGSLITLEKIPDGFKFAGKLFDKIFVPPAVIREVSEDYPTPSEYLNYFHIHNLIEIIPLKSDISSQLFNLDPGESEAISLASELKLNLLIEEKKGKRIANQSGIKAYGVAGLIYKAFQREVISTKTSLDMLKFIFQVNRLNKTVFDALEEAIKKYQERKITG